MDRKQGAQHAAAGTAAGSAEAVGAGSRASVDMGLKAENEQQDGWTTVAGRRTRVQGETKEEKTRSDGGGRDPSTAGPGRLNKVSPRKTLNKNKTEGILQSKNGGEGEGGDAKKGRETFKQLRRYLLQDAKQEYVLHTIIRLGELASSRRFLHWVMAQKKDGRTEQQLKKDWKDRPTAAQTDKYKNVQSYWDLRVPEHARGLCQVMLQWVVTDNLDQDEVERRLHFFHIQGGPESKATVSSPGTAGNSYLGAVNSGRTMSGAKVETNEQKRMKELCTRPVERVVELRERTADEDRALIMILNHELELARPPTFLIQSMDAEELAVFTDLFHAIEYPLYAHLAPGQRFDNDMACESILRLVHAGREAAPQHKQEILEFKAAMSRILLDAETRLITVTFKGKQSAARWIGWKMPFAAKLLPLVDYKQQREEAKKTHALVQIDFYEFSVAVRRGTMNSRDFYWLLTKGLGLEVQEMKHPEASTLGVNDKEWIVTVKGAACPAKLREIAFITIDDVDMVVHHHTIHAYWPCRTCHSPDHSTKSCRVEAKELSGKHAEHGKIIQGHLPTKLKNQGQLAGDAELPTTIEQLQLLLKNSRMAGNNSRKTKQTKVGDSKQTKSRARSPSKRDQHEPIDRPALPMEWEMHRQPVHQQEEKLVDHERQCVDGGCRLEKESKTEESTPPYYGTMSPEENNSNLTEDNVEQQAAEGDYDYAGDEKMREVSVEGEKVNTQSEAGSSMEEGNEVAFSRAERGRSPTRTLRNRGSRGGSRFDALKQDGHRDGFETGPARTRKSVSPKRTAPAEWEHEGNDQSEGSRKKVKQDGKRSGVTRSLSPRKRGHLSPKKRDKKSYQQYMHQYLLETVQATASKHTRLGGSPVFSSTGDTVENPEARKQAYQVVKEVADGEDTEGHPKETEDADCVYAGTKPGSDAGEALETWIGILGGTVTDVAANGQCGWLAGYAALYNHGEGVLLPTSETAEAANLFKKEVLNGMIASIVDEVGENPENLEVELEASSISMPPDEPHDSRVCALANHYVRQRTKSVQALVPAHFWVRPAHLKGMSIHARETIYVLDVNPDGIARVQAYAYRTVKLEDDDVFESGTVHTLETRSTIQMWKELIGEGILIPVLILKWSESGNHFQAITYDADRYRCYARNLKELAGRRNEILAKYGRDKLDFIQYEPTQVAKEAAKQLRELRRQDKIHKRPSPFKKGFDKGPQAKGEDQAERGSRSDTVQPTIGWATAEGLAGDEKVSRKATENGAGMPSVTRDLDEEMTDPAKEQTADNAEGSLEA